MSESTRTTALRIALVVIGAIFVVAVWPLTHLWPSGWRWHDDGRSLYLEMILGIYATLGIFLMIASRDPRRHRSLIWFTVWSSLVHAGIMAVQSVQDHHHMGHLAGDVPALVLVAGVLAALAPRRPSAAATDEGDSNRTLTAVVGSSRP